MHIFEFSYPCVGFHEIFSHFFSVSNIESLQNLIWRVCRGRKSLYTQNQKSVKEISQKKMKYLRFGSKDYFRMKAHMQDLAFLQEETTHVDFSKKIQDNEITCSGLRKFYCLVASNYSFLITYQFAVPLISSYALLLKNSLVHVF